MIIFTHPCHRLDGLNTFFHLKDNAREFRKPFVEPVGNMLGRT